MVLPVIEDAFNGKYIELDFSENLAMKPKCESAVSSISGVISKKGIGRYIFEREIKNEAVIIK